VKQAALFFALALALSGSAQAQSNEELKSLLDQALKTIQDLQNRVKALEEQKQAAPVTPPPTAEKAPAPEQPAAPAVAAERAPVVAPDSVAEKGAPDSNKARLEITGKVQLDTIYDFKRMNPQWAATERPSQIPVTCPGDPGCGKDGSTIFSIRQSAIAFKGYVPTSAGELKTILSFDLFGTGGGNTQIRVLEAWAELDKFGVGQYYSLFMNIDTFPNIIDYWGPNGMVFVRNPQVRYTPIDRDGMKVAFSLEAPNAAIDTGKVSEVDPAIGAQPYTPWPDFIGKYSLNRDWGNFEAAGILRSVGFQTATQSGNPSGTVTGWGINLNGWLKTIGKDRITGQIVYGHAIASYMNDGGVDIAPNGNLQAEAVPSLGWFAYYDHWWSDKLSSSIGLSTHRQWNTAGQFGNAFKQGEYASTNLLWYPAKNVLTGAELLWGKLEQFNGLSADDVRVQFSGQFKF
jgi:hypothetical protein